MKLPIKGGSPEPTAAGSDGQAIDRTEVLEPQVGAIDSTAVLEPAELESTALLDDSEPGGGADAGRPRLVRAPPRQPARRCPKCESHYSGDALFCPFDGEPLATAPDWDPGSDPLLGCRLTGRFEVESVIAEGGMGTVYRVRHMTLDSVFAMKVLRRDLARDEVVAARLVDEARATAAIGHPNIVAVTDFGEINSAILPDLGPLKLPYFIMELIGGDSLLGLIRKQGPLSLSRTANLMLQVASALEAAHNAGVIHRDLKPENIRVSMDGSTEVAKVLDFGVAKVIGSSRKTQKGMVFGTPHYMSPEQGQGHVVDQRTDIYALGVIIYECLTGKVPFAADTFMGVVTKHMFARPEPLSVARPEVGDSPLEPVMMRCLEKEPQARYQSMAELKVDLEGSSQGTHAARMEAKPALKLRADEPKPTGGAGRLSLPSNDIDPRVWLGVGAAGLALATGLLVWMLLPQAEPAATAPASTAAQSAAPTAAPTGSLVNASQSAPPAGAGSTKSTPTASTKSTQSSSSAPATMSGTQAGPRTSRPRTTRARTTKSRTTKRSDVVDPWGKR